jgi:hypothetical protein
MILKLDIEGAEFEVLPRLANCPEPGSGSSRSTRLGVRNPATGIDEFQTRPFDL